MGDPLDKSLPQKDRTRPTPMDPTLLANFLRLRGGLNSGLCPGLILAIVESNIMFAVCPINADIGSINGCEEIRSKVFPCSLRIR